MAADGSQSVLEVDGSASPLIGSGLSPVAVFLLAFEPALAGNGELAHGARSKDDLPSLISSFF